MTTKVVLAPRFRSDAKQLKKRFPRVMQDLDPLLNQLTRSDIPGDRIQGLPYRVYKVRVKNSDSQRGKSGGYRVIYYLETEEQIVLLTIYSKSDQSDLPIEFIRRTIEDYLP
jgi:mRNA-degrading endonuclease RelE of RelBE toxin-antitoxin system